MRPRILLNLLRLRLFWAAIKPVACLALLSLGLSAVAQSIQPIYSFTNALAHPTATLALGPDACFYGTTFGTGSGNYGEVFRITTNGLLATLARFANTNGRNPSAGLTFGRDGNFYGTTFEGGISNGTVFQITTNGTLATIYSFSATANYTNADGANPYAGLTLGPDGEYYGTAGYGGSGGYGTVFQITSDGVLTTLASFGFTNGSHPYTELVPGPDGNFYGTTVAGGSSSNGAVFQITTNGTLTRLTSFAYTNGATPSGGLAVGLDGNFYGTTQGGGSSGNGTVYRITANGNLTMLASFSNTNGASPRAALTLAPDGSFYGTTFVGGSNDNGTVFRITTNGVLTALCSFSAAALNSNDAYTNTDGAYPAAALTLGPDGNFYSTTYQGGSSGGGVVYRLNLPPSITTQPSNQIVAVGSNATFAMAVFGTAPYAFQWLSNGTPLDGATNSTLIIPDVTASSAGNYQVIVTNAWGNIISRVATLTLGVLPMITNQPASESVPIGGTAGFVVGATGTPPLAYQWYFNTNTLLSGASNAGLSLGPVVTNEAGEYQVIVTSPYGSATSSAADLTVLLQPNCYGISESAPETVTLLLASTPGSTNRLWATTNVSLPLAQWQIISTNTADDSGLFQFTDTNAGAGPARFYILSSP